MATRVLGVTLGIVFLLSACDDVPGRIGAGPNPADPSQPTRERGYRSVTGDVHDYRIVTPKPWSKSNEGVAPKPK